jgi:polyhydroxybutyrate depolymerase
MRSWPGAALAVLLCAACIRATEGGTAHRGKVRVGDAVRTFVLFVPAGQSQTPLPLVLAFHGTGGSGAAFRRETGLDRLAARDGFLVAYPDAAVGNWAEDCGCSRADRLDVNDTGLVRVLIDSVSDRYPVDRARVYAVGFSQGGLFVHRLACQMSDRVAAVASISSPISAPLAERCGARDPVAVLVMMGTLDDAYLYEGQGWESRATLGARSTVELWRTIDGCEGPAKATNVPNRVADGTTVLEERWSPCNGGSEVVLYTVDGGRHAWSPSRDVSTAELVTRFFMRQRKQAHTP